MELLLDYVTQTFLQESSLYIEENYDKTVYTVDTAIKSINNAKQWLYTFSENFYIYSYDINIYLYPVFESIFSKEHARMLFAGVNTNLLVSLFDISYYLYVLSLPMLSRFFHRLTDDWDFCNIINYHPEYILVFKNFYYIYFHHFYGNLYSSIFLLNVNESFITPPVMVLQIIGVYFFIVLFTTIYFNYFLIANNEDNIIDHDYLYFNVTIEAEEEIGSVDDMLLSLVILIYVFF